MSLLRCINRTKVELKSVTGRCVRSIQVSINRTKVELKCRYELIEKQDSTRINRTKVELKLFIGNVGERFGKVSIVPKWNWNPGPCQPVPLMGCVSIVPKWNWNTLRLQAQSLPPQYQSYQSGIEIWFPFMSQIPDACINRTKVELKSSIPSNPANCV